MGAERRVFLTRDQEPISPQGHSRDGPARHSARHQRGDGRQMVVGGGGVREETGIKSGGRPGERGEVPPASQPRRLQEAPKQQQPGRNTRLHKLRSMEKWAHR